MRSLFMAVLGLGFVLFLGGCSAPLTTAVIEVSDWKPLAVPIEIAANGKTIGTYSERSFAFAIPPGTTSVSARVPLPCRVKEIKIPLRRPTDRQLAEDKSAGHPPAMRGSVAIFVNEIMGKLWVDNRDGSDAQIKMGLLDLAIPADSDQAFDIPLPLCADNVVVSLNGEDLGPWPQALPRSDLPNSPDFGGAVSPSNNVAAYLFLDVSGRRCYHYRQIEYVRQPQAFPYAYGGTSVVVTGLTGHKLYPLTGQPDYFLTSAPQSVTGGGNQLSVVKKELVDVGCSQ